MVCTNCGAHLMETDQFCPKCGTKAIREKRCPDCGTVLREGTKFCHECGRALEATGNTRKVSDETIDIPIASIEKNILSETAAEIRGERRTSASGNRNVRSASSRSESSKSGSSRSASSREESEHRTSTRKSTTEHGSASRSTSSRSASERVTSSRSSEARSAAPRKKSADPMPPQRKRTIYREEEWEEDDWEDDDWDDDDEEGVDVITVMTAVVGCVLLVVVAVLGYNLYKQHVPKNYDRLAENSQEEEQEEDQEQVGQQELEQGEVQTIEAEGSGETYTLTVTHNVNVRDNPSTSGTNVLKVAQEGETYTCYGTAGDGEWYQILLEDGSTGYVFKDYVTVN